MKVVVLVIEGVFDTGLAAILDTLAMANELSGRVGLEPCFEVRVAGVRAHVHTQHGFKVPLQRAATLSRPDLVIIPALGAKTPDDLDEALSRRDVRDAVGQITAWRACGACLGAACTGTYVLAATGLLDGLRATTSWWLAPDFRVRFADVTLDETKMIVAEPGCITAGAALAHVDLALWFVRQQSPNLARVVSRYLLVDNRPSQVAWAMRDHLAHTDVIVERFERWARANLAHFTMAEAARAVGASERTLERRLRKVLGRTPIAYVRDLRVECALHRLETTDESVDEIAEAVGYRDGVTLRTLLRKKTGRGIRELRRRSVF